MADIEQPLPKRPRVQIDCSQGGRTKQSHTESTDINAIMRKHLKGGDLTHIAEGIATYGDFTKISSYQEAINQVEQAEREFGQLPAKVRDRVQNDPEKFLAFIANPDNLDECIELGIVEAKSVPNPHDKPESAPETETNPPAPVVPQGGE